MKRLMPASTALWRAAHPAMTAPAAMIAIAIFGSSPAAAQLPLGGLTCTPQSVNAPGISTCTVSLSQLAPLEGVTVNLQSSDYPETIVPPSVFIQPGKTSADFSVTVANVPSDQGSLVIAYENNFTKSFQLALVAQVQLSTFNCSPSVLTSGQSGSCTLGLNKPTASDIQVNLLTSTPNLSLPAVVTIKAGTVGSTFAVSAAKFSGNLTGTITAQWNTSLVAVVSIGQAANTSGPLVSGVMDSADNWSTNNCTYGSWRTITGIQLSSQIASANSLVTTLGGVQVMVNGTPAPLTYVSNSLVTFQCPALAPGAPISVTITNSLGSSSVPIQSVVAAAPSVFVVDAARAGQGLVLIGNTATLAMPATAGYNSVPAVHGQFISIYATGLGNVLGTAPALAQNTVKAWIGGISVTPAFVGSAQSGNGVFQIIVQVPDGVLAGPLVPLYVEVDVAGSGGNIFPSNQVQVAVN
jgi:uncharacterized protein (TIGR03437 family)